MHFTRLIFLFLIPTLTMAGTAFDINQELYNQARTAEKEFNKTSFGEDRGMELEASKNSGTSAYVMFNYEGQRGAILPENSATVVLGEVFSYQLSRALEVNEIFSEKTLMFIQNDGLPLLDQYISELLESNGKAKIENTKRVRALINKAVEEEGGIFTAYAPWNLPKPTDFDEIVSKNKIKASHPMAKLLRKGKISDKDRNFVTKELKKKLGQSVAVDIEVFAKDLSNLLVVDFLTNQWDRYSGGNLQIFKDKNNVARIGAYDNGGTFEVSTNRRKASLKILRSFDENTKNKVLELASFIRKKKDNFSGVNSIERLKEILELDISHKSLRKYYQSESIVNTNERYWKQFEDSLLILEEHIMKVCQKPCHI